MTGRAGERNVTSDSVRSAAAAGRPVAAETRETVLYTGDGTRDYCAFPSILEQADGSILCVWKEGAAHMGDEGVTKYLLMEPSGRILGSGTAAAVPGFNTQNAELLRLRDGSVRCWVDVQDYQSGKTRTGARRYDWRDGTFVPVPGVLTDTDGKRYGYVFDGMPWRERDWMLAMTFPELNAQNPEKAVHLLVSGDGETWTDTACLDALLGASLNESSFATLNEKLYVFCRGYDARGYMAVLDADGKPLAGRAFTEADGIRQTGRPKLFVRDGVLFGLMRNAAGGVLSLDLIEFDAETLAVRARFVLDDACPVPAHGYYAEPYFDGSELCVVTYLTKSPQMQPDIVLLRTNWNGGHLSALRHEIALPGAEKRNPASDQGNLVIHLPDGWDGRRAVLALHGSGRGTQSYDEVPFYIRQKEIALERGYAFAILQNMQDTYGTDIGYHNVERAANELLAHWTNGERLTIWATSAGGVGMYRYAAEHRENVRALIGTFAVFDLESVFPLLSSCRKAWGADRMTAEEFAALVKGKNPGRMIEALRGIPIYLAHGTADAAVPIEENAYLIERELEAYLCAVDGGVHGTADFRYYEQAPLLALAEDGMLPDSRDEKRSNQNREADK